MKSLQVIPYALPCSLEDCPPGLFLFRFETEQISLGFKTEYGANNAHSMEVYCADSGEVFWGGVDNVEDRGKLTVLPAAAKFIEV